MKNTKTKGSITVEAAIVFPLLICCIITIGFFSKVYYTQQLIQHAITEAAQELSSFSYAYYSSGLYEIQQDVEHGLNSGAAQAEERMEQLQKTYFDVMEVVSTVQEEPTEILDQIETIRSSLEDTATIGKEILTNPLAELKSFISLMARDFYDDGKTAVGNTIVKQLMKKHLLTSGERDIERRMQKLHIVDGWAGLDLSRSQYFDRQGEIDIVVTYAIDLPVPIKVIGEIPLLQRVVLKPWMKGALPDQSTKTGLGSNLPDDLVDQVVEAGYDVWALPVMQRGREIKGLLGRNLAETFPKIDSLEDGRAIAIRTHDTRLKSNQGKQFYYQLTADIRELENFKEASHQGVKIGPGDYHEKRLHIVVPDVALSDEQIQYLRDAKEYAGARGIGIKIIVVK